MTLDVTGGDGAARTLEFAHMVLQVGDIEASKHFYLDLLGMTPRPAIPLADGRPVVPFKQGSPSPREPGKNRRRSIIWRFVSMTCVPLRAIER